MDDDWGGRCPLSSDKVSHCLLYSIFNNFSTFENCKKNLQHKLIYDQVINDGSFLNKICNG